MHAVTDKVDGVFLWARIALQDLLSGVLKRDTLEMLQARLKYLDGSLDGYFAQLLGRIDQVHRRKAASYLQFLKRWSTDTENQFDPTLLDMAFACEPELGTELLDLILKASKDVSMHQCEDEFLERLLRMRTWLIGRSAGLLDVRKTTWSDRCYGPMFPVHSCDIRRLVENSQMSSTALDAFEHQECFFFAFRFHVQLHQKQVFVIESHML